MLVMPRERDLLALSVFAVQELHKYLTNENLVIGVLSERVNGIKAKFQEIANIIPVSELHNYSIQRVKNILHQSNLKVLHARTPENTADIQFTEEDMGMIVHIEPIVFWIEEYLHKSKNISIELRKVLSDIVEEWQNWIEDVIQL